MQAVRNTCLGSRSDQGQESGGSRPLENLKHTVPSRRHWIDKVSYLPMPSFDKRPNFYDGSYGRVGREYDQKYHTWTPRMMIVLTKWRKGNPKKERVKEPKPGQIKAKKERSAGPGANEQVEKSKRVGNLLY